MQGNGDWLAEGVGFEPTVGLPLLLISSQVPLTTQPPFRPRPMVNRFVVRGQIIIGSRGVFGAVVFLTIKDTERFVSGRPVVGLPDFGRRGFRETIANCLEVDDPGRGDF
jgi:hypothetical protein